MPSFLTVNNNVALLSITIAPSTWVASLTLALVFLYLYLPPIAPFRLVNLFFRGTRNKQPLPADTTNWTPYEERHHNGEYDYIRQKALPDLPPRRLLGDRSYFAQYEREQSLGNFTDGRERSSRRSSHQKSSSSASSSFFQYRPDYVDDGSSRSTRSSSRRLSRRLLTPLSSTNTRESIRPSEAGPLSVPIRGERDGGKRVSRFSRWLQSAGLETTRKRRQE